MTERASVTVKLWTNSGDVRFESGLRHSDSRFSWFPSVPPRIYRDFNTYIESFCRLCNQNKQWNPRRLARTLKLRMESFLPEFETRIENKSESKYHVGISIYHKKQFADHCVIVTWLLKIVYRSNSLLYLRYIEATMGIRRSR
jgi:hypothetical protein